MHTTDERMKLMLSRVRILCRRRENRQMAALSGVTAICVVCLVGLMSTSEPGGTAFSSLYGSALLYSEASAYVLVGVITFVLGAAVTGFCLWRKHKHDTQQKPKEDEEE